MHFLRKKGLIARKIENEYIVIDPNTGIYLTLNLTGQIIYKYLWQKRTENQIINMILKKFDTTRTRIKRDVKKYLQLLIKEGIIKKV